MRSELAEVRKWIVLVVEDEPEVRKLCCTVLQRAGLFTIPACGSKEALRLCRDRDGAIDLLLTDVNSEEGPNGVELADVIRSQWKRMAVLIMSGAPGSEELAKASGHAFLAKPFAPATLIQRASDVLRQGAGFSPSTALEAKGIP
jgi:DNA-binding response OmpR family regulator